MSDERKSFFDEQYHVSGTIHVSGISGTIHDTEISNHDAVASATRSDESLKLLSETESIIDAHITYSQAVSESLKNMGSTSMSRRTEQKLIPQPGAAGNFVDGLIPPPAESSHIREEPSYDSGPASGNFPHRSNSLSASPTQTHYLHAITDPLSVSAADGVQNLPDFRIDYSPSPILPSSSAHDLTSLSLIDKSISSQAPTTAATLSPDTSNHLNPIAPDDLISPKAVKEKSASAHDLLSSPQTRNLSAADAGTVEAALFSFPRFTNPRSHSNDPIHQLAIEKNTADRTSPSNNFDLTSNSMNLSCVRKDFRTHLLDPEKCSMVILFRYLLVLIVLRIVNLITTTLILKSLQSDCILSVVQFKAPHLLNLILYGPLIALIVCIGHTVYLGFICHHLTRIAIQELHRRIALNLLSSKVNWAWWILRFVIMKLHIRSTTGKVNLFQILTFFNGMFDDAVMYFVVVYVPQQLIGSSALIAFKGVVAAVGLGLFSGFYISKLLFLPFFHRKSNFVFWKPFMIVRVFLTCLFLGLLLFLPILLFKQAHTDQLIVYKFSAVTSSSSTASVCYPCCVRGNSLYSSCKLDSKTNIRSGPCAVYVPDNIALRTILTVHYPTHAKGISYSSQDEVLPPVFNQGVCGPSYTPPTSAYCYGTNCNPSTPSLKFSTANITSLQTRYFLTDPTTGSPFSFTVLESMTVLCNLGSSVYG